MGYTERGSGWAVFIQLIWINLSIQQNFNWPLLKGLQQVGLFAHKEQQIRSIMKSLSPNSVPDACPTDKTVKSICVFPWLLKVPATKCISLDFKKNILPQCTDRELKNKTNLIQQQHSDTGPTGPNTDSNRPGVWQGNH